MIADDLGRLVRELRDCRAMHDMCMSGAMAACQRRPDYLSRGNLAPHAPESLRLALRCIAKAKHLELEILAKVARFRQASEPSVSTLDEPAGN